MPLEEITGTVTSIRWPVEGSDFVVGELQPTGTSRLGERIKIVGNCDQSEIGGDSDASTADSNSFQFVLTQQCSYRFFGSKTTHETYGQQFTFKSFIPVRPHTQAGVVKYLQQCDGIGIAIARALWNKFRGDAVKILREQPEVAAAAVSGLTTAKATVAAETLSALEKLEDCSIELMGLLDGRGFPKATAMKALKKWGNRATDFINHNPFLLMSFRGCGFLKCFAMHKDLGLPLNKMKVQVLCAWYSIASDTGGSTWYPRDHAEKFIRAKIGGVTVDFDKALSVGKRHGILASREICGPCKGFGWREERDLFFGDTMEKVACHTCSGDGMADDPAANQLWVTDGRRAAAESSLARKVAEMMQWRGHWPDIAGREFDHLSDHQREQLHAATSGAIGALGGGPGTGKTTSTMALVESIVRNHGNLEIAIAAPTNKAAHRCREVLHERGFNGVQVSSIHSLLGVESAEDGWSFRHGPGNPLPFKFLIIDEKSMPDLSLMNSLISAVAKGTCVLLSGDIHQLPPIGHGAPARDMLAAGIPQGTLTETWRNAGSIVEACKAIRLGMPIHFDHAIDLTAESPRNLRLVQGSGATSQKNIMAAIRELRGDPTVDPIDDVQVMVAVNKRSPVCRETLNELLADELNPNGHRIKGNPFRVGDKVVKRVKSGFFRLLAGDGSARVDADARAFISNGEFGRVREVKPASIVVEFTAPRRVVQIPITKQKDGGKRVARDNANGDNEGDGGNGGSESAGGDIQLGYAASVHSFQGSETEIGLIVWDEYPGASGPFGVCSREWATTAISRAKRYALTFGKQSTVRAICGKESLSRRKTFLQQSIEQYRRELQ